MLMISLKAVRCHIQLGTFFVVTYCDQLQTQHQKFRKAASVRSNGRIRGRLKCCTRTSNGDSTVEYKVINSFLVRESVFERLLIHVLDAQQIFVQHRHLRVFGLSGTSLRNERRHAQNERSHVHHADGFARAPSVFAVASFHNRNLRAASLCFISFFL